MAKRFTKPAVDWAKLEKMVPWDQKTKFMAFKAKSDSYFQRVRSIPAEPPKINWEEYKKLLDGPIVDKLKCDYEKFKVPFPEDKVSALIDKQWTELQPKIKTFCADVQKSIDEAQKSLDKVKAIPTYEDMTMEMYYDYYPKLALDPVNRPSFWPHNPEEQLGYLTPAQIEAKKKSNAAKKK